MSHAVLMTALLESISHAVLVTALFESTVNGEDSLG